MNSVALRSMASSQFHCLALRSCCLSPRCVHAAQVISMRELPVEFRELDPLGALRRRCRRQPASSPPAGTKEMKNRFEANKLFSVLKSPSLLIGLRAITSVARRDLRTDAAASRAEYCTAQRNSRGERQKSPSLESGFVQEASNSARWVTK